MIRPVLLISALMLAGCASHEGRPDNAKISSVKPVQVTVTRNFVYTPADWPQELRADLYKPVGNGPFPGVVMIHGGGWEGRTREDMDDISRRVAERGYVVMNMSYRFAPQWRFPAQLQDVQQAVLWLRAHGSDHNLLKNRIGTWGYSAGAHLAALAGVTGPEDHWFVEGSRVQAVVAGGTPLLQERRAHERPDRRALQPESGAVAGSVAAGAGDPGRPADVPVPRHLRYHCRGEQRARHVRGTERQ
jgi:acetyl esterase/lipase